MTDENKPVSKKPLQASKAPPPIRPIGSSPLKPHEFDTNVKGSPNWKHWRHVSTIEIWQGLLLSLNIEPPGNGWLLDNATGGTGDIPYEYLDSRGLTDEFTRRWRLVCNRLETLYASVGNPRKAELTNFLRLPLFAAWAVEFEWGGLPPELSALAKAATQAAPIVKTAVKQGNKLRRNNLDPAIDKAIKQAENMELADVYLELKALALTEEKPFTGVIDGDALCYTDDNNDPAKLTKDALGKRLKNRR